MPLENTNIKPSFLRFLLDVLVDAGVVIVLVILIRHFVFAPFRVDGPSMCDTFNFYNGECLTGVGEFILTSRLPTWHIGSWTPGSLKRGDVIIFQAPYSEEGRFFIKRIIGLPGETVKIEDGKVYVEKDGDFVELEESYLNEENKDNTLPYRVDSQSYTVPEGHYFVMGDNRVKSSDSRRCFQSIGCDAEHNPFLDHDAIQGEVKAVMFPLSHLRLVHGVDYGI